MTNSNPSKNKHLITGIIAPGGGRTYSARKNSDSELTARVWFSFNCWRIDDSEVQYGELKLIKVGSATSPTGGAWPTILRQGRVIRVDAWFDEEPHAAYTSKGDWHFGDNLELDVEDDIDLSPLGLDVTSVSPATETWHQQKLKQNAVASGVAIKIEALKAEIEHSIEQSMKQSIKQNKHAEFSKSKRVFIGPNSVMGGGAVEYQHRTHDENQGLGKGKNATLRLRTSGDDIYLIHTFDNLDEGNGYLRKFLTDVVSPIAEAMDIDFSLSATEAIVPDVIRVEPIEIEGLGMAHAEYSVLNDNASGEAVCSISEFVTESFACDFLQGRLLCFSMRPDSVDDDVKKSKISKTIINLLEISPEQQEALLDYCNQRLWKLRHKKRRDYDATDTVEIADIWAELTISPVANIEGTNIELTIHKPSKNWPLFLTIHDGNKVTKLA